MLLDDLIKLLGFIILMRPIWLFNGIKVPDLILLPKTASKLIDWVSSCFYFTECRVVCCKNDPARQPLKIPQAVFTLALRCKGVFIRHTWRSAEGLLSRHYEHSSIIDRLRNNVWDSGRFYTNVSGYCCVFSYCSGSLVFERYFFFWKPALCLWLHQVCYLSFLYLFGCNYSSFFWFSSFSFLFFCR